MGLLTEGIPLSWPETKALAEHVRRHGIEQFINHYHRLKDRSGDSLKWGDEIEYILVKFDEQQKKARVVLKAQKLLDILNEKEETNPHACKALWRPEFGAYMIEGTPGKPFEGFLTHFTMLEANMRHRREEITDLLERDECILSMTNFPRLGCEDFTYPSYRPQPNNPQSQTMSKYYPDETTFSGHPRFSTASRNTRLRRGEKVDIRVKVFRDRFTKIPVEGSPIDEPDVVQLDATGLGMGCGCLQTTFQASDMHQGRVLYDQLATMCPIMLALTAASPIYRGYLTETDCRWSVISASVDCRTPEEKSFIPKSRCDSISSYLSAEGAKYNDIPLPYNQRDYEHLRQGGVDHLMAQHIAHLFVRDTICLLSEKVHQNDEEDTDHFENIQSTNWQTMRFKPPPPNSSIGWRVEFRPCDVQISDFENAAIVCFIILLTRVILAYDLNFLLPISRVDENMKTAQKRDACRKEKFYFRRNIFNASVNTESSSDSSSNGDEEENGFQTNGYHKETEEEEEDDEYELMTLCEIFNGKSNTCPGLIPLIFDYLKTMDIDSNTYGTIEKYLKYLQKRASGEILTDAQWIREQVLKHPEYKHDSIVSERITYDLLKRIQEIQNGKFTEQILKSG
ncbi:glutamate--cysteine ligase-like [Musca vetustissima]|uniref:glutamate--cysteine ligase-like n=1 Tax=Musca vetustissima TaxID=27455 RepID=UPI002AB71383|nr:glutamate--cysteine ligase-like [Musca vetustissima]